MPTSCASAGDGGGRTRVTSNLGLDVIAPFGARRSARVAMKLAPSRKFRNRWHRQVLKAHCPPRSPPRTTKASRNQTSGVISCLTPSPMGACRAVRVARRRGNACWVKILARQAGLHDRERATLIPMVRGSPHSRRRWMRSKPRACSRPLWRSSRSRTGMCGVCLLFAGSPRGGRRRRATLSWAAQAPRVRRAPLTLRHGCGIRGVLAHRLEFHQGP